MILALSVFAGSAVRLPRFFKRARLCGVVLPPQFAPNRCVQFASAHLPTLPYRVNQRVQPLPGLFKLGSGYAAKRPGAVFGLVVAPNKVPARIAAPEWQASQVGPVRVNLAAVRQSGVNIPAATAAVNTPNCRIEPRPNGGWLWCVSHGLSALTHSSSVPCGSPVDAIPICHGSPPPLA